MSKSYRQDQALEWGFLTVAERSHRARREAGSGQGLRRSQPTPGEEGVAEGSGGGGA